MTQAGSRSGSPSTPDLFCVVVNHEEQYAIWPAGKPVPEKWRLAGVSGSKQDCLDYVRRTWTDMRPLSVRRRHEQDGGTPGQ
jgi:MbtH protein